MRGISLPVMLFAILGFTATAAEARVEIEAARHHRLGLLLLVKVSEEIAPGDFHTLSQGLSRQTGSYARKILMLDSIGGSISEAIRMGRLLRKSGFDSLVSSTSLCQGSCIYLLAAGHKRAVRGVVGLHRPYFPEGDSARSRQAVVARNEDPANYLREMSVASSLFEDMQRIEPHRMRILSEKDLVRYRLE